MSYPFYLFLLKPIDLLSSIFCLYLMCSSESRCKDKQISLTHNEIFLISAKKRLILDLNQIFVFAHNKALSIQFVSSTNCATVSCSGRWVENGHPSKLLVNCFKETRNIFLL